MLGGWKGTFSKDNWWNNDIYTGAGSATTAAGIGGIKGDLAAALTSKGVGQVELAAGMPLAMAGLTGNRRGTWGGIAESTGGGALVGAGIGTMMVPMFTGAMGSLSKEQVARASMTINILQQVGASIGTALMAVILTHELDIRGLGRGGIGTQALKRLNPLQDHVAAQAFAHTFAYSIPMLGVALLAGVVFLPRKRREHIPIEVAEEAAQSFIPLA